MKKLYPFFFLLALAAGNTSCATIVTKSSYPVMLTSTPGGADITIVNRDNRIVYTGSTPTTVKLKSAAGYMKKEEYIVTFRKNGFEPQTISLVGNLDGWYIGNIFLGGLIGMLIVDPASGAMYKFSDTYIHASLKLNETAPVEASLYILNINDLPQDVDLVQIK